MTKSRPKRPRPHFIMERKQLLGIAERAERPTERATAH
jgi:hypothetical protein